MNAVPARYRFRRFITHTLRFATFVLSLLTTLSSGEAQQTCEAAKANLQDICCKGDAGLKLTEAETVFSAAGQPGVPSDVVNVPQCDGTHAATNASIAAEIWGPLFPRMIEFVRRHGEPGTQLVRLANEFERLLALMRRTFARGAR